MGDILGDEDLRLLRTKFYYKYLDNGYNDCKYSDFYDLAEDELKKNKELYNVSDQILKALCYVYRNTSRGEASNDICKFLYYWLGDILLKKLDYKPLFTEIIINLFGTLKDFSNVKICKFDYTDIDEDVFNKIKLIFDYTEDYEDYKVDLAKPNRWCNEKYHSYLTTYVKTYKELYSKCKIEHKTDKYCVVFNKYFNDTKHNNLYNWSCILKETSEDPSMKVESGRAGHQEQREVITDGRPQSEKLPQIIKAEKQQLVELPVQVDHNLDRENSETIITEPLSDDKSTSITSKSITGGLSVAGILVPSYLMYNYTPAGIWISKLLGRNKGPNFNSYANQELMPNLSMPGDLYSERSRYNISYRPE
ncbi:PIR protein [Plasmodium vivax]|uniref:VIR protein n=1 Tax=Plasmodium vivax TaxID=5855 RepID=A0A565A5N3_PLAVI|nr:PIR protein [Plasmodium vivax]